MKFLIYFLLLISAACYASPPQEEIAVAPRLIEPLQIVYPPKAQRLDEEGTVVLKIRVLADGSTGEKIVHKSSGYPILDADALKSVTGIRFHPAKNRAGMPVDSSVVIPFKYILITAKPE